MPGQHPYTGRPNASYMTVVLERLEDEGDAPSSEQRSAIFESLTHGIECVVMPGYRVTAISIGDVISDQEYAEETSHD